MNLATSPKRPSSSSSIPPSPPPLLCFTLIPTAWGPCGILWRQLNNENSSPFNHPPEALLCRIIIPGLSELQLRSKLRQAARKILTAQPKKSQTLLPTSEEALAEGNIEGRIAEILPDHQGHFHPHLVPVWFAELVDYLQTYLDDTPQSQGLPRFIDVFAQWQNRLDFSALTTFQRRVLETVGRIPRGQVLTYGDIARQLNHPRAARAVGAALRANPWPILIPCHRVIGSTGALTGFTAPGGVTTKKRLLTLENSCPRSLFRD